MNSSPFCTSIMKPRPGSAGFHHQPVAGITPDTGPVTELPLNDAETGSAPLIVTAHVIWLPVHVPLQPWNTLPGLAVAVSTTCVPEENAPTQVPPVQTMPAGTLVTVPLPATVTDRLARPSKLRKPAPAWPTTVTG